MDDEKRAQNMENVEERESYPDERMEERFREGEPVAMESEEEFREEEVGERTAMEQEEKRHEHNPTSIDRELVPLLEKREAEEFRARWQDIQTEFVDDPRHSVENADELVAQVINSITENFANERNTLEDQWNRGEEASTEDLRVAMMRYRSFFNRLLTLEFTGTSE